MQGKKYNTPSCIDDYMYKININRIHISIFAMPEIPNCKGHHKIQNSPNRSKNPIWGIKI